MYEYYSITSLGGGLNLRQDSSLIQDHECVIAENCDFSEVVGGILSRKRIKKLNATAMAGKVIKLYRYVKSDATAYLIAETDDGTTRRIYYSTDDSAFSLLTTRTTGYRSSFVDYEDWLYFLDIQDEPKRWNGTSFTKWGIAAPGTAPTLAEGSAGNLSGTYQYKITFLNAEGTESANSPASSKITVSSKIIELSAIPTSTDGQVTKRRVYRFGGTLTDYYLINAINDNTTTTYSDNTIDTDVGPLLDPYDRYPAPNAKASTVHYNRIFLSNILYGGVKSPHGFLWSRARRPENFYDPSNPDPAGTKGKNVLEVVEMGESVYFLTEETIYALRGANEDTFYLDPTYVQIGCFSKDSVCKLGTSVGYLGSDGYYFFNGLSSKKITDKVESVFTNDLNKSQIAKVGGVFNQRKNRIYITYPKSPATDPDRILIYDLLTTAFHEWPVATTSIYFDHHTDVVLCGSSDGYVYELESDNPTEANTTFKWKSKAYDFGQREIYKTLFAVRLTIKTAGQDVTFNQYIDNVLTHQGTINTDYEWLEVQFDVPESGINFQTEITGTVSTPVRILPPLVYKYKVTDIKV
ncbi:MAG: hypothetical protein AB1478_02675 [Nitrospirota bacterium]